MQKISKPDAEWQKTLSPEAYRVLRDGKPVIGDSRLGFILRNDRQLLRNRVCDRQDTDKKSARPAWAGQPIGIIKTGFSCFCRQVADRRISISW